MARKFNVKKLSDSLVAVGAINWGIIGAFGSNPLATFLSGSLLQGVYIAIGVAGLMMAWNAFKKK